MAKPKGGAPTPKKKQEAGFAFKFPNVRDAGIDRGDFKPEIRQVYETKAVPALIEEFGYKNRLTVPRIEKIVLNMGLGEAIKQPKLLEQSFECLGNITGQRPVVTRARKSIATFKLREGMKIGAMVTLRRAQMWDFLDRLLLIALPRTRDFRGVSRKAFDGRGNFTLGVREQIIFPEINYDRVDKIKGMNITFVTTAETDEHGRALLRGLGMPFRK
jgi:large subunit ribosomal protein L5